MTSSLTAYSVFLVSRLNLYDRKIRNKRVEFRETDEDDFN